MQNVTLPKTIVKVNNPLRLYTTPGFLSLWKDQIGPTQDSRPWTLKAPVARWSLSWRSMLILNEGQLWSRETMQPPCYEITHSMQTSSWHGGASLPSQQREGEIGRLWVRGQPRLHGDLIWQSKHTKRFSGLRQLDMISIRQAISSLQHSLILLPIYFFIKKSQKTLFCPLIS